MKPSLLLGLDYIFLGYLCMQKKLEFMFKINLFIKFFISAFTLFDFALEKKFTHVYSNPS